MARPVRGQNQLRHRLNEPFVVAHGECRWPMGAYRASGWVSMRDYSGLLTSARVGFPPGQSLAARAESAELESVATDPAGIPYQIELGSVDSPRLLSQSEGPSRESKIDPNVGTPEIGHRRVHFWMTPKRGA